MIDIIKTPKSESVAFNTSPVDIHIRSIRGVGYYFTMLIYVNGELYDTQQRSKIDGENCFINFKDQVQGVFGASLQRVESTGIVKKEDLVKRIDIVIREYEQGSNAFKDEVELPEFYLVNSNNSANENLKELNSLSIYDQIISIPLTGLVSFPVYSIGLFTVKLFKNSEEIWTRSVDEGFGVFAINFKTIDFNFRKGDEVYFEVSNSGSAIRRDLVFPFMNGYGANALLIQNNYNAFEYFYCFGDKEVLPKYKSYSLKLENEIEKKYKTDERIDFKLNTGYFNKDYLQTLSQIPKSLLLYLIEGEELIEVRITNRNRTPDKQRKYLFNETLSLSKNQLDENKLAIDYFEAPTAVNITVEGYENDGITVTRQDFFNSISRSTPINIIFPLAPDKGYLAIGFGRDSETVEPGKRYSYATFSELGLYGKGFGIPFLKFPFVIETPEGKTNTAYIVFNRVINEALEAAPIISVAEYTEVFVDEYSKTIVASITEPNDQAFTVAWRQIGGAPIGMFQTNTNTLLLRDWSNSGTYEFEVIATDIRGNKTIRKTKLKVMNYKVNLALGDKFITIYGGKPGGGVVLRHTFETSSYLQTDGNSGRLSNIDIAGGSHKFIVINKPGPNNRLKLSPPFTSSHRFGDSGNIYIPFTAEKLKLGRTISVLIIYTTGVQEIGYNQYLNFTI